WTGPSGSLALDERWPSGYGLARSSRHVHVLRSATEFSSGGRWPTRRGTVWRRLRMLGRIASRSIGIRPIDGGSVVGGSAREGGTRETPTRSGGRTRGGGRQPQPLPASRRVVWAHPDGRPRGCPAGAGAPGRVPGGRPLDPDRRSRDAVGRSGGVL